MPNKDERPAHVQEFVGKYEETNPISRYLLNNFYNNLQVLLPDTPLNILEVGCGAGLSAERIIPMCHAGSHFEGSDVLSDLTDLAAERNPGITFTPESVYKMDRKDNSFDLILGLEMLEHLEDPEKALMEMKRVSSRYLLLSVPREPIWRILNLVRFKYVADLGNTPGHLNHWSTSGFRKFAAQAGTVVDYRTPLPWTMVLVELE